MKLATAGACNNSKSPISTFSCWTWVKQANYVAFACNKILLTPVLMAFLAYINSLHGDFVHDDIPAIVRNPDVNGQNAQVFQVN